MEDQLMADFTKRQRGYLKKVTRAPQVVATLQNRPMSKLDQQAKDLGVYCDKYHLLTRRDRKSIVSTAFTKQAIA
jgi:hypothetical protein